MNLENYRLVAAGKRLPAYVQCARQSSGSLGGDTVSLLDMKSRIADRMLESCALCEHRCGVNRLGDDTGLCGVGRESFYFFEQTLWGEEPPLVPSHEVFFSGCNLRCKFCYSWQALLNPNLGTCLTPESFAELIEARHREGAVNLNLIGGEPTVHLPAILKTLRQLDACVPIVWNSNFFMSDETMRLLNGVVDLYLGDFRFGCDACAKRLGGVNGYVSTAKRNFKLAHENGDLIIRHLLLPGHIDCCLAPIVDWVSENLPDVPFNLMFQYTPFFEALDDPELCRSLVPEEEKRALDIVASRGLNTQSWREPLDGTPCGDGIGKGEISTTITIRPDGRVGIMHLHGELLDVVRALECGGE